MSITQLLHTVKHLKPGQVTNRLVRRIRKPGLYRGAALTPVEPKFPWVVHAAVKASFVVDGQATFLNESGPLLEWKNPQKSKLWLYNLHYFDDLVAESASDRVVLHRKVISRWLADNPPLAGTGWEPYPLSLRVCNWIKWLLAGNETVEGMRASLVEQAHALSQQVEHHLLGNHILANAKALVFAGAFFDGETAEKWLQAGLALLDEQLAEQVLADGAHFELSPMYHSIILMDVLDLIQLGQLYPGSKIARQCASLRNTAGIMASWLEGMLHPDDQIPFFNDAAFDIAPPPKAIIAYAHSLGVVQPVADGGLHYYDASGYVAVHLDAQFAVMDVANIGPDYMPGHAHADTLSFEWSLKGQRVLVNSGTSLYGVNEERLRQRQTAAHNTVVVNGQDSSEVWSGFRVARRARPFVVKTGQAGNSVIVQASHDGYKRLSPKVVHQREWRLSPGLLEVTDSLQGKFKTAVAYFHLHPSVNAHLHNGVVELILPDGTRCELMVEGGELGLEESSWHPEFGLSDVNQRVVVRFSGSQLLTSIRY
jgi:uncharacterized heparinase superfamily protein